MTSHTASRPTRSTRSTGWAPLALLVLVLIPAASGTLRLIQLAGGPELMRPDARMDTSPLPVVAHIVSGLLFAVAGTFQLSAALRRRSRSWHRRAGRVLVAAGFVAALSALWMTLFYARQPGTGELAYVLRLAFGSVLGAFLLLGFTAIRRGDVRRHRAWMIRAYALALGAGTQAFTQGVGIAVFGRSVLVNDLALGAGWAINLAIAEYVIRRRRKTRGVTNRTVAAALGANVAR